jgi:hypothetical protein
VSKGTTRLALRCVLAIMPCKLNSRTEVDQKVLAHQ